MKRFVMILTAVFVVTAAVNAQKGFTVGARLGPGFAFNELGDGFKKDKDDLENWGISVKEESNIAFAIAVYGNYMIFPKFSIQTELGLMVNNGMKLSGSFMGQSYEIKGSFTSLDIPILARYDFLESPVSLGVLGGLYLAFGFGQIKLEETGEPSVEKDVDGVRLGLTVGLAAGYKVGPGNIVADLRFLTDFSPVQARNFDDSNTGTSKDIFTRRGINLTVGYEMKF
jgi:hypothetical protein